MFSLFQTMEIRTLMLQIRRTSHRNSFYGSGKMQIVFICILTSILWITLKHYQNKLFVSDAFFFIIYTHFMLSMCVNPSVCEYVFVQLDHRKATSLPHHHPFGLFLGGSQAPVWNGLSPVSTQNSFLLDRICILWCVRTIATRQNSISLDWPSSLKHTVKRSNDRLGA